MLLEKIQEGSGEWSLHKVLNKGNYGLSVVSLSRIVEKKVEGSTYAAFLITFY